MNQNKLKQPINVPIGKRKYQLVQDYNYKEITVPKGFIYDGASIPRFLWSIVGLRPDGLIRAAALVHDWLYQNSGKISKIKSFTRKESDVIFKMLMEEADISNYKCQLAYYAVRVFGGLHWK
jgi:hypothetical protein